jgi:predicted secreted protein
MISFLFLRNIMANQIKLEASSYELIRQDKANVVLTIEVTKNTRAEVQKEIKKKADAAFKILKTFKDIHSSTQSQSIGDNLVNKQNKWEKEGFKGVFAIALIGYDFEKLNDAIEAVENHAQVSSIETSLSNKVKADMEAKLTQAAIKNFQERAKLVAQSFGFKTFIIDKTKVSRAFGEESHRNYGLSNMVATASLNHSDSNSNNSYVQPRDERISLTVEGSIILK